MIRAITVAFLAAGSPAAFAHPVQFKTQRTGILKEVRPGALVVELEKTSLITVFVTDTTVVHRNGKEAEVKDLRAGDHLVIGVMPHDGANGLDGISVEATDPRRKAPVRRNRSH
jgi:hypothetical protein